jgi:hypothetical protein
MADMDGSYSTQEFDCEEYNEDEILDSDDEIEISQRECTETLEGEIIDDETNRCCENNLQHSEQLNRTVVKTEVEVNIKQEKDSDICLNEQEMTVDLTRVKTEISCITPREDCDQSLNTQCCNSRVKQEQLENAHFLAVVKTSHGKEAMTENCNKETKKKRKQLQKLFGDSSDDEMLQEILSSDQNGSKVNKLSLIKHSASLKPETDSSLTHKERHSNKMDKLSLPLKNTSNNCNVKKICKVQEVTFKPVKGSSRYLDVQNTSEHLSDKLEDMQSNGNAIVRADRQTVADTVVKHLMPFYKEKRITSRDLFKLLARQLAHHLLEQCSTGKLISVNAF